MSLMYCMMTKWTFNRIQLLICWSPNNKITHHSHFTPFVSFFWPRSWRSSFRSLLHHWHLLFSQQQIHDFKRGFHARIIWQWSDTSWPARQPWAVIFRTSMSRDDTPFTIILNVCSPVWTAFCLKPTRVQSRSLIALSKTESKGTVAWEKYIPELQQDGKHPFPATLSFPAESFFFLRGGEGVP